MAHKTLIGGTAYEISGGKTLVGGTAYSIDKGKTLVGGTAYEISFGAPLISFKIKGMGVSEKTYTAEEGMTWGEFITSKYNDGNIYLSTSSKTKDWVMYTGEWSVGGLAGTQDKTTVIRDGTTYTLG